MWLWTFKQWEVKHLLAPTVHKRWKVNKNNLIGIDCFCPIEKVIQKFPDVWFRQKTALRPNTGKYYRNLYIITGTRLFTTLFVFYY